MSYVSCLTPYAFSPPDVINRRMPLLVAGVLVSLAELELEFGRERRAAAREARRARGQAIGRPKVLNASKLRGRRGCTRW
jgi:DNA invertase Pin-like site-specific DNA recombinase